MKVGVGLLVGAMALTPLTDGLSKVLVQEHSAFFVVFSRYAMAGIIALGVAILLKKPINIPQSDRSGQVFRTGLMMGAMVALIFALSLVPLAKAVGGFLIAPVVASMISVILFQERMCARRLFGSFLSFAGAYIILQPQAGFELGTFMALFGGVLLGMYLAATRRAATDTGSLSTLVAQCFFGAVMISPLAFMGGVPKVTSENLCIIIALGFVSALNHYLIIAAYRRAEASVLAPFFYFNIVFAIPVGYFWFAEIPSLSTMIGLTGIGVGGVLTMLSVKTNIGRKSQFHIWYTNMHKKLT